MNKVYKVVFNHSTKVWQVVSDIAKSHSKSKSSLETPAGEGKGRLFKPALRLLVLAGIMAGAQSAQAVIYLPMGMHAEDIHPELAGTGGYYAGGNYPTYPAGGTTAVRPAGTTTATGTLNTAPATNGTMIPAGTTALSPSAAAGFASRVNTVSSESSPFLSSNVDKPGKDSNTAVINGITSALSGQPSVSLPVSGNPADGSFVVGADANKGTSKLGYDQDGNGVNLVSGKDGSNNIDAHYGGNKINIGSNGAVSVETSDGKKFGFSTQKDKDGNNVGGMPNPLDTIAKGGLGGIVKLGHDTVNGVLGLTHIAGEPTPDEVSPGATDPNDPGSAVTGAFLPGPIPIPKFTGNNTPGTNGAAAGTTAAGNQPASNQPAGGSAIAGEPVMTPAGGSGPATVFNPSYVPGVGPVPSSPIGGAPLSPYPGVGPGAYAGTGYTSLYAMPDELEDNNASANAPSLPSVNMLAAHEGSAVSTPAAPVVNMMSMDVPDNPKWPPFTEQPQPIVLAALPVDVAEAVQPEYNDVVFLGDADNLKGGELRYHRYPGASPRGQANGQWQMYDPRYKDDKHDGWVEIKWRDGFGYYVAGRDDEEYCGSAFDFNGCSTPYYFYPKGGELSFSNTINRDPNSKVVIDEDNNNINFNAGGGVKAFRDQDGSVDIVANIDNDTIKLDDQGRLTANVKGGEAAEPWNFKVNGEEGGAVAPGGDLDFTSNDKTVNIKATEDGKGVDFGVNVDGKTITVGEDGKLSAVIPEGEAGWDGFTTFLNGKAGPKVDQANPKLEFVDGEGTTVTNGDNGIAYNVVKAGVALDSNGKLAQPTNPNGFVDGANFVDVVNKLGWNAQVKTDDPTHVGFGDTVKFVDGKGTTVSGDAASGISWNALVDNKTIRINEKGELTAIAQGGDTTNIINGGGADATKGKRKPFPAVTTFAAVPDSIMVGGEPVVLDGTVSDGSLDVAEADQLRNQMLDMQEAGFGLQDQDGASFKQELGTAAPIVGDGKNIATKVVDQQDGSKALSVQLGKDLLLEDGANQAEWNARGIAFKGSQGNNTAVVAGGIVLDDKDQNRFAVTSDSAGMYKADGSQSVWSSQGLAFLDQYGSGVEVNRNGIAVSGSDTDPVALTYLGLDNGGNKIVHVADGELSAQSTDAVNGSQLFSTIQKLDALVDNIQQGPNAVIKGVNFAGDAGKGFNSQLGSTVTITGGVNQPERLVGGNIGVVSDGQSALQIGLASNLRGLNSVQTGATTMSNEGIVIQAPTPVNPGNVVSLTGSGLNNGGNRITNVAPAVEGTDAVNLNQLNSFGQQVSAMGDQLNQNIRDLGNQMSGDMRRLENNSRAGTASAIAAAGLPTAVLPNEKLVTIGGGVYHGESGYAIGISTVTENGRWILKGAATGDSRSNYGGSGAIGYRWF